MASDLKKNFQRNQRKATSIARNSPVEPQSISAKSNGAEPHFNPAISHVEKKTKSGNNVTDQGTNSERAKMSQHHFGRMEVDTKKPKIVQAKLNINIPGDKYEQEADAMANSVVDDESKTKSVHTSDKQENAETVHRKPALNARNPVSQTEVSGGLVASSSMSTKIDSSKGGGNKLDTMLNADMSSRFRFDFSNVKIHADSEAAGMNRELKARAFTVGNDIYFNSGEFRPESNSGKHLLAHELTHVTQQNSAPGEMVQCLRPEDVSQEMVGRDFELLKDQIALDGTTNITRGTKIKITLWANSDHTIMGTVKMGSPAKVVSVEVDKQFLKPVGSVASTLTQYTGGVAGVESSIGVADKSIAAHKAKEPDFIKAKNTKGFTKELSRMEGLQKNRYDSLNSSLIQETMFNRFDAEIVQWVNYYNSSFKPASLLDPEIVKSLIFEETKMGTRGDHLEMPPYGWTGMTSYPLKSRFNLGQSIDSWGPQEFIMIKEMSPAIFAKYKLADLEKNAAWKSMTNTDYELWNSGDFVKAMAEFNASRVSGKNLNATSTSDIMEDYNYWIRVAVRWLFEKYRSLSPPSWPAAVKAFNGDGPKAENYKKRVMGRVP